MEGTSEAGVAVMADLAGGAAPRRTDGSAASEQVGQDAVNLAGAVEGSGVGGAEDDGEPEGSWLSGAQLPKEPRGAAGAASPRGEVQETPRPETQSSSGPEMDLDTVKQARKVSLRHKIKKRQKT